MKHLFLFFICIVSTSVGCLTALAEDLFPISKTPWGISRQQTAKAIDIKMPLSVPPDGGLSVSGFELNGFDGTMGYVFLQDRLVEINFSIDADKQPKFTKPEANKLRERLERQFTKNYGQPQINRQQCDNVEDCHFSLWHKDTATAVGLFFVDHKQKRNIGISYMQRKNNDLSSPFYQPHKGLILLPPEEKGLGNSQFK